MISLPEPSLLKQTAEMFKELIRNDYIFHFSDKTIIRVRFSRGNYHHLIGLHKYTDIAEVTINKPAGRSATAIFTASCEVKYPSIIYNQAYTMVRKPVIDCGHF